MPRCIKSQNWILRLIIRLKLFIQEADSLGVLPLVDGFCLRKDHHFFFGDDHVCLRNKAVAGTSPEAVHKLLMVHMDYFPTLYAAKGYTAHTRWLRAAAKRTVNDQEICGEDALPAANNEFSCRQQCGIK